PRRPSADRPAAWRAPLRRARLRRSDCAGCVDSTPCRERTARRRTRPPAYSDCRAAPRHRRGTRPRAAPSCALEEIADLLVRDLGEVLVPHPDRVKGLRRPGADELVDLGPKLLAALRWRRRDGDDDSRRLEPPQRRDWPASTIPSR